MVEKSRGHPKKPAEYLKDTFFPTLVGSVMRVRTWKRFSESPENIARQEFADFEQRGGNVIEMICLKNAFG
jgi:hypothetical protein